MPIVELIAICRDREDDEFLELAVKGRAELISAVVPMSLDAVRGIPIVTPAAFVRTEIPWGAKPTTFREVRHPD